MDKLTSMTTFAKVLNYASFTAAAADLGISRALVSRQITELETYFGVRLLNRTTRSVTPTEAGLRFYELCNRVLGELRAGEDSIAAIKQSVEGDISILCPNWVGNFDVSQAVVDFAKKNPKINIQLNIGEVSGNPHEFLSRGYDVCIQPDAIRDSDIMVKKIGEIEYLLAASPEYLARRGDPLSIADLAQHDCLPKRSETAWVFKDGQRFLLKSSPRFSSTSYLTLCTAAVSGLGITLLPRRVAGMDLRDGNLCQVLSDVPLEGRPFYIAFTPGGGVPRKIRVLIDFLSDWFKKRSLVPDDPGRIVQMAGERRTELDSEAMGWDPADMPAHDGALN